MQPAAMAAEYQQWSIIAAWDEERGQPRPSFFRQERNSSPQRCPAL